MQISTQVQFERGHNHLRNWCEKNQLRNFCLAQGIAGEFEILASLERTGKQNSR